MVTTRTAFTLFVATIAGQRLAEVRYARRNARALLDRGGVEHAPWQMPAIVAVQTAWLIGMCLEVWWRMPPFRIWLAIPALALFVTGQMLRLSAMQALGLRWTVRIITLPGAPPVVGGIYRYLRHPNYLGVMLEVLGLPLIHGAVLSAAICSAATAIVLAWRIRAEERALAADNAYFDHFRTHGRFLPVRRPPSALP